MAQEVLLEIVHVGHLVRKCRTKVQKVHCCILDDLSLSLSLSL